MGKKRDYTKLRVVLAVAAVTGVVGTYAAIAGAEPGLVDSNLEFMPMAEVGGSFTPEPTAPNSAPVAPRRVTLRSEGANVLVVTPTPTSRRQTVETRRPRTRTRAS
jgi:hypothetical protein